MSKKTISVIIFLIAILVWLAPIGMMPGFFIGGSLKPAPAIWEDTSAIDEVHLKVGGVIPRVVIIWIVQVDGELYVTGAKDSGWVTQLGEDSDAELRIGDNTYPVVAERQNEKLHELINALYDKYRPNYPNIVGDMSEISTEARPPGLDSASTTYTGWGKYVIFKLASANRELRSTDL